MKKLILILIIFFGVVSCDDFITEDIEKKVLEYESAVYVTLTDIQAADKVLPRGTKIKLKMRFDKDWVKVYGYKADVDELLAGQVLILYLFDDSFEDEKFSLERFKYMLFEKIKEVQ